MDLFTYSKHDSTNVYIQNVLFFHQPLVCYYRFLYNIIFFEIFFPADINDKVTNELQELKVTKTIRDWRSKVLGGGRINHDAENKIIKVYGYSQVNKFYGILLIFQLN